MNRKLGLVVLAACSVLVAPGAFAQEYFGDFLDKLKGGFVDAQPRPVFKLETEFRFKDPNGLLWSTPAGAEVDGASIPQVFWSLTGGPFEGAYINASVIHDYYCRTKERTAHDTHRNFYYGMRASQVPYWKAELMYWVVSTFGPSWKIERRIVPRNSCASAPGKAMTCASAPTPEVILVSIPPVDLSDPTVLAAAINKTTAVARTLRTSNGKVLDVTDAGNVTASAETIDSSAERYRQVFASKDFSSSAARLGLLSQPSGGNLADIAPWSGNRIPKLSEAIVLTPETVSRVEASAPFKLDPRSKDLIQDRIDVQALGTATQMRNFSP